LKKKTEKSVGDEARYQEGAQRKKEPKGGQSLSDDDDDDDVEGRLVLKSSLW
jgi:hypothetical protein